MKKLTLLATIFFMCIALCQAQKLVLEKANPSFGPYESGDTPTVVLRLKNPDSKPVIIQRYFPRWLEEEQDKNLARHGPQRVITIAPGKTWELRITIPTSAFGVGKHKEEYMIGSNATNLGGGVQFSFEIKKGPDYGRDEEKG